MTINRLQVRLTGGTMGDGVATHYFASGATLQSDYVTFWNTVANIMAGQVTVTVPNTGEQFNELNGALVGAWSDGTLTNITGGGSGTYAGGVGACINWKTTLPIGARLLRGRTFIVPLAGNSYDTDGTLSVSVLGILDGAAIGLIAATGADNYIWHRPTTAAPGSGETGSVESYSLADRVSSLRSRR